MGKMSTLRRFAACRSDRRGPRAGRTRQLASASRSDLDAVTFVQGHDVYAAGDQMAQVAGAGFSARATNHADVSPTSTMCQNALMGSVSTG